MYQWEINYIVAPSCEQDINATQTMTYISSGLYINNIGLGEGDFSQY